MNRLHFQTLYREFLFRIVDLELLAPRGDITKLLGQFAALLIFISVWLAGIGVIAASAPAEPGPGIAAAWAVEHLLIATTMLAVGLFAVLSWDSFFPDRRDVLVLSPLPVRTTTIFLAKVAAVLTALGLTVATLNVFTGTFDPPAFAAAPILPPPQYDPALPPVAADGMQAILDRDIRPALATGGALAAGTDAGVSIGVLTHGDRRVFTYGTAQPDSIFEIGSVSKTFTGLILSRMVLQGSVRLNQPVQDLLPAGLVAKPRGPEISLLDLITHHSGLPRMPDNFHPADITNPYAEYLAPNLFAYISKRGVAKPSNTGYLYSNLGVGLLGQVLADHVGTTYRNLLQQEVTGPLGLTDTTIALTPEQRERFIRGHRGPNVPQRGWDLGALEGAGGIRSTAGDLLTYLDAQLHPERFPALMAAINQSHILRTDADPGVRIALAWHYDVDAGVYLHNGATGGYTSYVFFNAKQDYAAAVLMNTGGEGAFLTGLLADHIRQRFEGRPAVRLVNPVIPGRIRFLGILRAFAAYWTSTVAAGVFIFSCVLGLQGLAQFLPRQIFLRLSSFLQMAFFVLLVTVYFLQPPFSDLGDLSQQQQVLRWLPSYWFFGMFQSLNGPIRPELEFLVRRAWIGLGIASIGAIGSYLVCLFRTLRKIAEQPDILPSRRSLRWLPPFGNSLETALGYFAVHTLLRSRQHRVILSFYLGIALGLGLFISKAPALYRQNGPPDIWYQANVPLLVASILMMVAAVMGTRVVFAMPLEIRANWIFRILPLPAVPQCLKAIRRSLYALVATVWLALAALLFWLWPWHMAAGHLLVLALIGAIVAEACLAGFRKIPFTCSYQPGKSRANMAFLLGAIFLFLITKGARWERDALASPDACAVNLLILSAIVVLLRLRTNASANAAVLQFDDPPEPAVMSLGLYRDGVLPMQR